MFQPREKKRNLGHSREGRAIRMVRRERGIERPGRSGELSDHTTKKTPIFLLGERRHRSSAFSSVWKPSLKSEEDAALVSSGMAR